MGAENDIQYKWLTESFGDSNNQHLRYGKLYCTVPAQYYAYGVYGISCTLNVLSYAHTVTNKHAKTSPQFWY